MSKKRGERTERLTVYLQTIDLEAINDFRFRERMPSLAATIRELLRRGLSAGQKKPKNSN